MSLSKPKYFTVEQSGDTVIFSAVGSIGGLVEDAAREEWDRLLAQLDQSQTRHAIIDLGALDYFGSIMLELLVVLWKRVSSRRGKMALCRVSPVGLEILRTAKFDTLWAIALDRDDALRTVHADK